jgi:hypothetical protein
MFLSVSVKIRVNLWLTLHCNFVAFETVTC